MCAERSPARYGRVRPAVTEQSLNFYKHHIGDFDQATRHLSFVEDAAYSRMIRKYYAEEKVLPVDVKKIERLIGARTKEEREAVAVVLEEFFVLEDDGWHNKRCDEELAEAQESVSERDEKKANERERQKRHRIERKALFEKLRSFNIIPSYDTPTETLRTLLSQRTNSYVTRDESQHENGASNTFSEKNLAADIGARQKNPPAPLGNPHEIVDRNAPVTRTATANQTPDTRHQTPDLKAAQWELDTPPSEATPDALPEIQSTLTPMQKAALPVVKALRAEQVPIMAVNPLVAEWIAKGLTEAKVPELIAFIRARGKTGIIHPNFINSLIDDALNPPKPKPKQDDWHRSDAGIARKAKELRVTAGAGWSYDRLKEKVWDEIRRKERQGEAA